MASLLKTNLRLLIKQLAEIHSGPFFNDDLRGFVEQLLAVSTVLLEKLADSEPDVANRLIHPIWRATRYLSGSQSNAIPYEVVFCLEHALREWTDGEFVITTAITQDRNFHFAGVKDIFYDFAEVYTGIAFNHRIVQIALPALYRHRPLYALVLYHELGHFVDDLHSISGFARILMDSDGDAFPDLSTRPDGWSDNEFDSALVAHSKEYFADLFATCYLGTAIRDYLGEFAGGDRHSSTHPATYARLQTIEAALEGEPNAIIQHMESAIRSISGVRVDDLTPRFEMPEINERFDQVRPCALKTLREVHGLFQAGWEYLQHAIEERPAPWNDFVEGDIERAINDLTEKSIRNFMICERWNSGAA